MRKIVLILALMLAAGTATTQSEKPKTQPTPKPAPRRVIVLTDKDLPPAKTIELRPNESPAKRVAPEEVESARASVRESKDMIRELRAIISQRETRIADIERQLPEMRKELERLVKESEKGRIIGGVGIFPSDTFHQFQKYDREKTLRQRIAEFEREAVELRSEIEVIERSLRAEQTTLGRAMVRMPVKATR
jgi:wobble nucleotide-excising tRNase